MAKYVTQTAQLKCSYGDQVTGLRVPGRNVQINDKPQGNILDFKANINIPAFGMCSSRANPEVAAATAANQGRLKPMPCTPAINRPWIGGKTDVIINGSAALLDSSKLMCNWCGRISIIDCGQ